MCRIMPIPHRKGTVLTVSTKTNRTVSLFTSGGRNYYAQGNHDAIAARLLSVEMVELLRTQIGVGPGIVRIFAKSYRILNLLGSAALRPRHQVIGLYLRIERRSIQS